MSLDNLLNGPIKREDLNKLILENSSPQARDLYTKDISSIFGKALDSVMSALRYGKRMPDHYLYLDMEEKTLAATIITGDGTVIVAYNRLHAKELESNSLLRMYVSLHEHAHVRGEKSEHTVDGLVGAAARNINKWTSKASELYTAAKLWTHSLLRQKQYASGQHAY